MRNLLMTAATVALLAACQTVEPAELVEEESVEIIVIEPEAAAKTEEEAVDYRAIARRVVVEAAGVQPGDTVVLFGSASELPMLEALIAETWIAGGEPIATLNTPTADKAGLTEAPMEYLSLPRDGQVALIEMADVFINAGSDDDPTLFADVGEDRINAVREASGPISEAFAVKRARSVDLGQAGGIPTPAYAESFGADYRAMREMFFGALDVSVEDIAARGAAVSSKMSSEGVVTLTSAAGSDIAFSLEETPARISAGRAADNDTGVGIAATFLPAGDYYACIAPDSADGVIVQPTGRFRGVMLSNIKMTFEDGLMTNLEADEGEEILSTFFSALDEGSKRLSVINIGLNPKSAPLEGSDYLSWEMSGVATLVMGDASWAGCAHGGEGGYVAHLAGTTLTAGEAVVIEAGDLALD